MRCSARAQAKRSMFRSHDLGSGSSVYSQCRRRKKLNFTSLITSLIRRLHVVNTPLIALETTPLAFIELLEEFLFKTIASVYKRKFVISIITGNDHRRK